MTKHILLIPTFFILFLSQQLSAQSLYDDAILLANAIENNFVQIVIESDTTIRMYYEENGIETPFFSFEPPIDSIRIYEQGDFFIRDPDASYTIQLNYDTLVHTYTSAGTEAQLNNSNEFISVKIDTFSTKIPKQNYVTTKAILQSYLDAHEQISHRTDFSTYDAYLNNPYLGRFMAYDTDEEIEADFEDYFENLIDQRAKDYEKFRAALYVDSITDVQQFVSIRSVQEKYEEPVISSTNDLVDISEGISKSAVSTDLKFNTSTFVAGLSDFIAKRAQEEFNITFMDRFRDRLNDTSFAELHVLFPESKHFLNQIDITNYKSALLSAREAFTNDIHHLTFNMPRVFTLPKYESIQNIPEVYDMLLLYTMIDLIYREIPIDEILPFLYRKVEARTHQLDKSINLRLIDTLENNNLYTNLCDEITQLDDGLIKARDQLLDQQADLEVTFLMKALEPDEAVRDKYDNIYFNYHEKADAINDEMFNAWDTIRHIPNNLNGQLYFKEILEEPSIDKYPGIFDDPPSPSQLKAAGLELSRYMIHGINGKPNKAQLLLEWDELLQTTLLEIQALEDSIAQNSNSGLQKKLQLIEQERLNLQNELLTASSNWGQQNMVFDSVALLYLAESLNDSLLTNVSQSSFLETINTRLSLLERIKNTAIDRLKEIEDNKQIKSPLLKKLTQTEDIPILIVEPDSIILNLLQQTYDLQDEFSQLDTTYANDLIKARRNTSTLSKVLEVTAHIVFLLQTNHGEDKTWITQKQFNDMIRDDIQRDAFLGLLYQRLNTLYPTGDFSSRGVATLTAGMINNFADIRQNRDSIKFKKLNRIGLKFEDFFPFVEVAADMINTIIETPILINDRNPELVESLAERDTSLAFIPKITSNTLSLFENIQDKQFNFAIYNILELYKIITERTLAHCEEEKGKSKDDCYENERIRNGILIYGTFIADVAMAQQAEDVRRALELVALPPGSSRLKREEPFNISVNSYFGLGLGHERLTNEAIPVENKFFNSIGLTVPVGISMSWKTSRDQKGSYTLFAPILDIGAVTSFRLGEADNPLPDLKFQNIIAPGGYLLYNLPKSPFSIGAGMQYGPQLRTITRNNTTFETSAWRFMLTATVDVPIFNLYGKRF